MVINFYIAICINSGYIFIYYIHKNRCMFPMNGKIAGLIFKEILKQSSDLSCDV